MTKKLMFVPFPLLLLLLIALLIHSYNTKPHQTAAIEQQSNLETYTYQITKIDPSGYYGKSTTNQTNIYFVNENVPKGTKLNTGDTIKVSFPNNSYEEITNIVKVE